MEATVNNVFEMYLSDPHKQNNNSQTLSEENSYAQINNIHKSKLRYGSQIESKFGSIESKNEAYEKFYKNLTELDTENHKLLALNPS